MEELNLNYGLSKGQRVTNVIVYSLFAAYTLYLCVKEGIINHFGVWFFISLALFLLAVVFILKNTVWLPPAVLSMDKEKISSNFPGHKSLKIDWINVSKVNIGPGYIIFLLNGGQKQAKIDLLSLRYEDLLTVKSKVIELCEYKNIPYQND